MPTAEYKEGKTDGTYPTSNSGPALGIIQVGLYENAFLNPNNNRLPHDVVIAIVSEGQLEGYLPLLPTSGTPHEESIGVECRMDNMIGHIRELLLGQISHQ
jgi:hypothetical protein